jgi:hypothetical protein
MTEESLSARLGIVNTSYDAAALLNAAVGAGAFVILDGTELVIRAEERTPTDLCIRVEDLEKPALSTCRTVKIDDLPARISVEE